MADRVGERGRKVAVANLWVAGRRVAHVVFGDMGVGLSPFPYPLIFPQDEHEHLLIECLTEVGVEIERQTELLGFENADGHVLAQIRTRNGTVETCTAAYIAGCDGARSTVREAIGVGFPAG